MARIDYEGKHLRQKGPQRAESVWYFSAVLIYQIGSLFIHKRIAVKMGIQDCKYGGDSYSIMVSAFQAVAVRELRQEMLR